ncbi:MAG: mobilization protein [Campylobacter ureolyticus]|nr:mobilization protein [Campylobacter ureolyticus]MDK8323873.1 mobilization protein [Campylobacter ureolyticus]
MGQISSINFKKSIPINTEHNDRTLAPNYLIDKEKGAECNRNAEQARALKNQIIKEAIQKYTENTRQKFQAKSFEWSAVVNIKPDTTMQDLENLAKHFNDKYGFQCYQIAIHRDEGHKNTKGEIEINQHAHMEFITLDKETGKQNFKMRDFSKQKMREIQTEVAEILQMERGKDKRLTGAKRIEPRKYAQLKEQEKAAIKETKIKVAKQIKELKTELEAEILSKKEIKEQFEAFRKENIGQGLAKEFFQKLSEDKKKLLAEPTCTQEQLDAYFIELRESNTTKEKRLFGEKKVIDYEKIIQEQQQTISDLNAKNEDLKQITQKSIQTIDLNVKNDLNAKFDLLQQQNEIQLNEELKKRKNELEYELIQEKNQVTISRINLEHQIDRTVEAEKKAKQKEQDYIYRRQELTQSSLIQELTSSYEARLKAEQENQAKLEEQNENLKLDNERLRMLNEFAMEMKEKAEQELKEIKKRLQNITEAVERAVKGSWQIVYDRSAYGFKSAHIKLKEFFNKEPQEQERIINSNIQAHKDIETEKEQTTKKERKGPVRSY